MAMPSPDWDYWAKRGAARAWEWLALSVDAEPRRLSLDHFLVLQSTASKYSLARVSDPAWLRQMYLRLQALFAAIDDPETPAAFDTSLTRKAFLAVQSELRWHLPQGWKPSTPQPDGIDPSAVEPDVEVTAEGVPDAVAASASPSSNSPDDRQSASRLVAALDYLLVHAKMPETPTAAVRQLHAELKKQKRALADKRIRAAWGVARGEAMPEESGHIAEDLRALIGVLIRGTEFPVKGRSKAFMGLVAALKQVDEEITPAQVTELLQSCTA